MHAGRMLENFPFSTGGRILAPVTPLRLLEGSNSMQLIVPSFDGFVYAIDASTGCAGTQHHFILLPHVIFGQRFRHFPSCVLYTLFSVKEVVSTASYLPGLNP